MNNGNQERRWDCNKFFFTKFYRDLGRLVIVKKGDDGVSTYRVVIRHVRSSYVGVTEDLTSKKCVFECATFSSDVNYNDENGEYSRIQMGAWMSELAYLLISAVVLWILIVVFGPSLLAVGLPLAIGHVLFIILVLWFDKRAYDIYKAEEEEERGGDGEYNFFGFEKKCNDKPPFFFLGYDAYHSLVISLMASGFRKRSSGT